TRVSEVQSAPRGGLRRFLTSAGRTIAADGGGPDGFDTERAQAIVRLGLAGTAAAVMLMAMLAGLIDEPSRSILITYMTWFMLVSVALYAAILRRPGVNHPRRIFAMVHDYTGITFCLCLGETLLPVYA